MTPSDLTDRKAVQRAIQEFDELGRERFLKNYGFGKARKYFLLHRGVHYDSKAIVGVAYGKQYPERKPVGPNDF